MSKLDQATSLFLRLHKDNPIEWRLWGAEALAEAEAQNKPISSPWATPPVTGAM